MSKHTPGPWAASSASSVVGALVGASATYHVAAVMPQLDKAEVEANARLIAAAPELLEACKAVEEWWLREGKHEFLGAPAGIFMLRAAIQKAEGGQ